ncbi:NUDIX hydrolase [Streptomyces sp. NPDC026665]|uniref:NUDIX hydrolase n=1 Tax=Streptomyces sp. NPDC026665 TaxID=3154798 RepID=UPI0033FEDB52
MDTPLTATLTPHEQWIHARRLRGRSPRPKRPYRHSERRLSHPRRREYLFLPGGRRENEETPLDCARRELREEAGITAEHWSPLGSHAITLSSTARVHLFEARGLTLGVQELTSTEQDFKLTWWPMQDALKAVREGRFLLPAGPLTLLLAEHRLADG